VLVPGLSQLQKDLLAKKNMPSSRDQIIDKIAKNSGVMIKRLNTIEIFEHIVKNRIIGLKSEQQQLSDRYIIFKC
jgi:hypothetical protein